jgi:hypothetical protein
VHGASITLLKGVRLHAPTSAPDDMIALLRCACMNTAAHPESRASWVTGEAALAAQGSSNQEIADIVQNVQADQRTDAATIQQRYATLWLLLLCVATYCQRRNLITCFAIYRMEERRLEHKHKLERKLEKKKSWAAELSTVVPTQSIRAATRLSAQDQQRGRPLPVPA